MDNIVLITSSVAGVTSHLAFFRIGEHHLNSGRYVLTAIAAFAVSSIVQSYFFQLPSRDAAIRSLAIAAGYFGGLYSSLLIYRVVIHPLRRFPGPFGCKVSSAWFATYVSRQDAYRQLQRLHNKYGYFLRIGSNDLSIAHPKAVQAIYGSGSKCRKADWYDITYPVVPLQGTRDDSLHSRRRRVWSTAFGNRNQDYDQRINRYRTLFVKEIEDSNGRPLDVTELFKLYGFDVMGDLAFGRSFQMLETSKEHDAIKLLNSGLFALGFKLPIWFFRLMVSIPGAAKDWWGFMGYCTSQLDKNLQVSN